MARFRRTRAGRLLIPVPAFWLRMSRGRRVFLLAILLLAAVAAIWRLAWGPVSEEDRVRAVVLDAIHAAEDESIQELAPLFSTQYRGEYGSNYNDLLARVRRDFALISDLHIRVTEWTIRIEGNRAIVDIRFRFRLLYEKAGPYSNLPVTRLPSTPRGEDNKARLILLRDEGQWRIVEIKAAIPQH